ncbi:MAG TPA: cytochrome c [Burkholderiaceae bacterium]|jgi:cytochrome c553|nr:cytochrome c [Burkholderiaceae bacterium]HRZ02102.1 cytochrome c [Burkholderiaceae bacterium]
MKLHLLSLAVLAAAALPAAAQTPAAPAATSATPNISACTGCHLIPGYRAAFPQVYHVPKIGGQEEKYLENALQAYKKGERNNATMHGIARDMSDAEIKALAAYFAKLGK